MSRCLVTGHLGYIGSQVYNKLQELGHEVLGIDYRDDSRNDVSLLLREDMDSKFHPLYADFKPEYIFHLACIPRVEYSIKEPVTTMVNNVVQTSHVLNFARKVGAKRVVYSGSSSVEGNGDGPESPYGLQKLISEMECRLYSKLYGLDTVSLRYFNVYSPCQLASGPYATAIANWMQFIREGKDPFITGTGEQSRDMCHLEDIVAANIFAMEYKGSFDGQNYDVGTGENISLNEVREIAEKYHPRVNFEYRSDRPGDVMTTCANVAPLRELGWSSRVSIKTGIEECFNF
jgi:nucleoside-diphosphate-sugar epimerase